MAGFTGLLYPQGGIRPERWRAERALTGSLIGEKKKERRLSKCSSGAEVLGGVRGYQKNTRDLAKAEAEQISSDLADAKRRPFVEP